MARFRLVGSFRYPSNSAIVVGNRSTRCLSRSQQSTRSLSRSTSSKTMDVGAGDHVANLYQAPTDTFSGPGASTTRAWELYGRRFRGAIRPSTSGHSVRSPTTQLYETDWRAARAGARHRGVCRRSWRTRWFRPNSEKSTAVQSP